MSVTQRSPRAGVIGYPISHSKSPIIHGAWLQRYGVQGEYTAIEVRPEKLESFLRNASREGFVGVNATIPHKEAALALADEVTPLARRIGAANTISFEGDRILADNTDAFGFLENLKDGAPNWRADSGPAVVLGAGGAARAVVAALIDAGAPELRLANRTRSRAETLAMDIGGPISVIDWPVAAEAMDGAATIVNTTSLGMKGQPPLEIDLSAAPDDALATDIVYVPLITPFLERAQARGLRIVDGLGMLLHQARPGFERWFGRTPEVDDELRHLVLGEEG